MRTSDIHIYRTYDCFDKIIRLSTNDILGRYILDIPCSVEVGNVDKFQLCAQPRVCSLTGENPVYPRPNQPDISESWDGISNGA